MPRILVIDDEEDVRKVVCSTLRAAGHEVDAASSCDQGLALLHAPSKHPINLVIMDILMPEKDGLEAIELLKGEYPDMKIIAMTGGGAKLKSPGGLLFTAEEAGADGILLKPFGASALYGKVNETLAVPQK